MNQQQNIFEFPIITCDSYVCLRDLGTLTFDGVEMRVSIEAFSESEDGFNYDFDTADILLEIDDDSTDLRQKFYDAPSGVREALETYLNAVVEGS